MLPRAMHLQKAFGTLGHSIPAPSAAQHQVLIREYAGLSFQMLKSLPKTEVSLEARDVSRRKKVHEPFPPPGRMLVSLWLPSPQPSRKVVSPQVYHQALQFNQQL